MVTLIPKPYECKEGKGTFTLDKSVKVKSDFELALMENERSNDAPFVIEKDDCLSKEEYRLHVTDDKIKIKASTEIGAYYALQSLRQLSKSDLGKNSVPCCEIIDKPRWGWRGLSLDESRHFFGKEEVKRLLDLMFMMKLNVFHWHLTDDQGWRAQIKKYPLLTEIGSKRKYSQINGWQSPKILNEPVEGFYTQDDLREIVAYAKERGIMVVPEIDMPAHFAAAMAAYPLLACRELEREVPGYFGGKIPMSKGILDWNRTACVGKETTFKFIYSVIDELCEVFDAPYFHIGGDEAPKNEWKKCPLCQKTMKENNLQNEEELQGWFNNCVLEYLQKKGRRLICWNDILTAKGMDKSVIAQYWTPQRDRRAEAYVKSGGNLILSNHQSFYFDMTYGEYPLKNTYEYSPAKFRITLEDEKNVFGIEAELWTEWIDSRAKLDLNTFPRMQALAEAAWTFDKNKNYDDFRARLDDFKPTLDELGVGYAVDRVCATAGFFERLKARRLFYRGDTHFELKLNEKFKQEGEK